ncbi:MAG: SDR family oxidoreductase [Xanthobacteraceae bacterium]|jgi:NAD(P)-dependent dehydrogenase (short-subunit alcohol dehydrogenase family)|nr:SDR family oxidoreductase [Xanthobacteraceae bacterium]
MPENRILLVTGASRGIGAAIARLAAKRGYDVAVNYAGNEAAANAVVADIQSAGRRGVAIKGDMGNPRDIVNLFSEVDKQLGRITDLVNNAGVMGYPSRVSDLNPETLKQIIDVNVTGAILVASEAVKRISTKLGGRGGTIVNMGSMAAILGMPGDYVWYAASKGALNSFTVGLAREVIGEGIRVNAVSPGLIDTDIHAAAGQPDRAERLKSVIPIGRFGTPEEVAETVLYLMSDQASYVVGANLSISGGR